MKHLILLLCLVAAVTSDVVHPTASWLCDSFATPPSFDKPAGVAQPLLVDPDRLNVRHHGPDPVVRGVVTDVVSEVERV